MVSGVYGSGLVLCHGGVFFRDHGLTVLARLLLSWESFFGPAVRVLTTAGLWLTRVLLAVCCLLPRCALPPVPAPQLQSRLEGTLAELEAVKVALYQVRHQQMRQESKLMIKGHAASSILGFVKCHRGSNEVRSRWYSCLVVFQTALTDKIQRSCRLDDPWSRNYRSWARGQELVTPKKNNRVPVSPPAGIGCRVDKTLIFPPPCCLLHVGMMGPLSGPTVTPKARSLTRFL